jgi:flagellar biosynthesis/type III secretory pathway protein FliH
MKGSKNFPKVSPEEFAEARDTLHQPSRTSEDYKRGYKNGYKKGYKDGREKGYLIGVNQMWTPDP